MSPNEIQALLAALNEQQEAHLKKVEALFATAFPDGDPATHKAYHEAQIAYMKERAALWKDIRTKTAGALVWFLLVALGAAVWDSLKAALSRH